MSELAELIRKGLAQEGVTEDWQVWGAGFIGGHVEANVIGLALIGKLGIEPACQLFEAALQEALFEDGESKPNTDKVLKELGLASTDQTEELTAIHNQIGAKQIAQMLESGELVL